MKQEEKKQQNVDSPKKRKSWLKRISKFVLYFFLSFLVLNVLLYIVLSLPFVQDKITTVANKELSKLLKTEVKIDAIRYKLFNYVSIENLYIADQKNDTLLFAGSVNVGIKPLEYLFHNQIIVDKAQINNIFLNAYASDSLAPFNYQFIIDEFSSTDSVSSDTSSTSLKLKIDDFKLTNGRINYKILDQIDTISLFNPYNIGITDLNINLSVKSIDVEQLDIDILEMTAKEKSGLEISNIRGKIKSENSKFFTEDLYIATPNSHLAPAVLSYDTELDEFAIQLQDAALNMIDFTGFYPNLKYLDKTIYPSLIASGLLPNIHISQFDLKYGDTPLLQAEGLVTNYEELDKAFFELKIAQLILNPNDIVSFARLVDESFEQIEILNTLGQLRLNATIKGELSDFTLTALLSSKPGSISMETKGASDTTFTHFHVETAISMQNFNLKAFTESDVFDKISLSVKIDALQESEDNLYVKIKGNIESLDIMNEKVKNLPFYAYMDPKKMGLNLDANLNFGKIKTDFMITRADYPDIDLNFHIADFQIAKFYKADKWNNPIMDFDLKGVVKSYNIDNLNANITLDNFSIVDSEFSYKPDPIELKAWQDKDKTQNITFTSPLLDVNLQGRYQFSTISEELSGLMNYYFPSVFSQKPRWTKSNNDFTFKLVMHNTQQLNKVLDLPFGITKPLELKGQINTIDKELALHAKLPWANIDSLSIKNASLDIRTTDSVFQTKLFSSIYWADTKYYLAMDMKGYNNEMLTNIKLKSDTSNINLKGAISFTSRFFRDKENDVVADFFVHPTSIQIEQFDLNILPAEIVHVNNKISIDNLGFGINGKEYFDIDGIISDDSSDSLYIRFTNAQIADILAGMNIKDIYAEIDGDVKIINTLTAPEVFTDNFEINNIVLYNDTLGSIAVQSAWNKQTKLIDMLAILRKKGNEVIKVKGNIDPMNEKIDLSLDVDRFDLNWIYPFVSEYLSKIDGSVSSQLNIKGDLSNPQTNGFFGFNNAVIGVDYTNVVYYISDTIAITPEYIGLYNLELKDAEGDVAKVNAQLKHDRFKDMKFSLNMQAKDLMVLNTQTRTDSLFFGKLYASGNIDINGDQSGIKMNMKLQNAKKSNLNIAIPQVSEASEYTNIVYINVPSEKLKDSPKPVETPPLPINMGIGITLNPSIKFSVIIDPITGDKMEVTGNGNINFQYNMENSNMSLFGDYTMVDGLVKLNLKNLYKIEFKIQEGSKLNFIGDPMNTKFNVVAYKRVKADLKTLDPTFAQEFSNTRVLVDCLLGISGNMNKMDLTYNIQLVDATDDQVNLLNSLINTSEAKVRQFAYLLTVGSFYPTQGGSGANFTEGMWTNLASSALSAGLNAVLGNVLGDNWQISADISDGDRSVSASTSFFDDKLRVTANVGYRDSSLVGSEVSKGDSFIGDFDIEYLLSPSWALKAYSHTNNQFYRQGSTIQGVGITYSKDASTFKGLFDTSAKRKARRDQDWKIRRANKRLSKMITDTIRFDSIKSDSIQMNKIPQIPHEK